MSGLETKPYWRDVGTIDAFWQANIDLTEFVPALDLYDNAWPIWTYAELTPPAKFIHDDDRRGQAIQSLVSGGCIISGAEVHNSLLFTNTRVHSYASLDHAVVLHSGNIGRHARLANCEIDSRVTIPEGLVAGQDAEEDAQWFRVTKGGITLITQPMLDRRAASLQPGRWALFCGGAGPLRQSRAFRGSVLGRCAVGHPRWQRRVASGPGAHS